MGRELSSVIQSVLATSEHNVFMSYDLTLADGVTVLRGAEVELTVDAVNVFGTSVAVTPQLYTATIAKEPQIKFSRGTSPNGGDLAIYDLDHALGVLVSQLELALEGADIVIAKCFKKANGNYESDVYFKGVVRDVKADDDVTTITVVADTDSRNTRVSARDLTQRCIAVFGDERCQRPAALIGVGETCSKEFPDEENGCKQKGWQAYFVGIPILQLNTSLAGGGGWGSGDEPGGGGGTIGRDCVDAEMFVNVYRSAGVIEVVKARDLARGMIVIDGALRCAMIEWVEIKSAECFLVRCANGASVICTEDHPLITSAQDVQGTALRNLSVGSFVETYNRKKRINTLSQIVMIENVGFRDIAKITLADSKTSHFNAGLDDEWTIEGHNTKIVPIINA